MATTHPAAANTKGMVCALEPEPPVLLASVFKKDDRDLGNLDRRDFRGGFLLNVVLSQNPGSLYGRDFLGRQRCISLSTSNSLEWRGALVHRAPVLDLSFGSR